MNLSLENKRALICGSTQGIGFAIAQELALLGASCILLARNEDALKKAITHLDEGLGQRHEYIVADLAHETDLRSKIDAQLKHGSIHILINNSGGPPPGPVLDACRAPPPTLQASRAKSGGTLVTELRGAGWIPDSGQGKEGELRHRRYFDKASAVPSH